MEGMSTGRLLEILRSEGFNCTPTYLNYLVRDRIVPEPERFGLSFVWGEGDVDRLKRVLRARGRGPSASRQETSK